MMNQEEYVRVHELRKQGWTPARSPRRPGFIRRRSRKWLKADGPPRAGEVPDERRW